MLEHLITYSWGMKETQRDRDRLKYIMHISIVSLKKQKLDNHL